MASASEAWILFGLAALAYYVAWSWWRRPLLELTWELPALWGLNGLGLVVAALSAAGWSSMLLSRVANAADRSTNVLLLAVALAALNFRWRRSYLGSAALAVGIAVQAYGLQEVIWSNWSNDPFLGHADEAVLIVAWALQSIAVARWAARRDSVERRAWLLILLPFGAAQWMAQYAIASGFAPSTLGAYGWFRLVPLACLTLALSTLGATRGRSAGRDRVVGDVVAAVILGGFAFGAARAAADFQPIVVVFIGYGPSLVALLAAMSQTSATGHFETVRRVVYGQLAFLGSLCGVMLAEFAWKAPGQVALFTGVAVALPASVIARAVGDANRRTEERFDMTRFRILRELGRGAYGRAFLADDTRLHRQVVLKEALSGWASDGVARERFLREAQLAARVEHPHVVRVYEAIVDRDPPTLVMEFVDGGSLEESLRERGWLPEAEVRQLGIEMLAGMTAIHSAGIVHRDLKPANVLLSRSGGAKITDFGVARGPASIVRTIASARSGAGVGSFAYMSPELRRGETVDNRSDIYAVGVILSECLTGCLPGDSTVAERESVRGFPKGWGPILEKALARDPADRYQTARDMDLALRTVLPIT